jgi:hypothetical protein
LGWFIVHRFLISPVPHLPVSPPSLSITTQNNAGMNNHLRDIRVNSTRPSNSQGAGQLSRNRRRVPAKLTPPPSSRNRRRRKPFSLKNLPPAVFAFLLFSSGMSLLAGAGWVSLQYMMNPDAVLGLDKFLEEESAIANEEPPQNLDEIEAQLRASGLIPDRLIPLKGAKGAKGVFLMPVMMETLPPKSLVCDSPCKQISELRIYQEAPTPKGSPKTHRYVRPVTQLSIEGPTEVDVMAPLIFNESENEHSNHPLPLTEIKTLQDKAPSTGFWFTLTGQRLEGDVMLAYGQVYHYNPETMNLSEMMEWSSPANRMPAWQQVTNGGYPELVIDQTVGLEPNLEVYQVQPRNFLLNPFELVPVSMNEQAFDSAPYRQVLQLAKNGLWSVALKQMQALKQQRLKTKDELWPDAAQAQLDVIELHANITKSQADANLSDPGQKALAHLIDGRWEAALKLFEADLDNTYPIALILKADKGQLWERVEAALKVEPNRRAIMSWGALIVAAQQGKEKALSWATTGSTEPKPAPTPTPETELSEESLENAPEAETQPAVPLPDVTDIVGLIDRLEVAMFEATLVNHPSQLMGSVTRLAQVNAQDWMLPSVKATLKPESGQVWYQIKVAGFHDGQQWLREPFNMQLPRIEPGRRLWRILGLNLEPKMQISVWKPDGTQATVPVTVKALSYNQGQISLLAAGEEISSDAWYSGLPAPIAFTADKFRWVQPATLTITQLNQQQPGWVMGMLKNLWQELQAAGRLSPSQTPTPEEMLQQSGNWQIRTIDVNGNQLPDAVITLQSNVYAGWSNPGSAEQGGEFASYQPKTMIFDDSGQLIYSEFTNNSGQFLAGFADLEDGKAVALVINNENGYSLKRWKAEQNQFE